MQRIKKLLVLVGMIDLDEDALICDFAETYNIYDYKSLPLRKAAIYAVGLRDNSRIKIKMNGTLCSFENIMLAAVVDRLSVMIWAKSKDATEDKNRPVLLVPQLIGKKDIQVFDSPEEYESKRKEILREVT